MHCKNVEVLASNEPEAFLNLHQYPHARYRRALRITDGFQLVALLAGRCIGIFNDTSADGRAALVTGPVEDEVRDLHGVAGLGFQTIARKKANSRNRLYFFIF